MKTTNENPFSDEQLLERLKNGDQTAFAMIYDRYAADLIWYGSKKLSSLEEARDLVHDLFVEFWDKRERIHINSSFKSYLFSAARYRIIDHIRKNARRDYYAAVINLLDLETDDSTHDDILFRDLSKIAESEIDKLPPRTREIFRLSRQRQLSVREIARELNLSDQTVKNQLSAALRKLKPAIQKIAKNFIFL
ncbi:RNA polymerase sigma factor [Anseongella ginsenosidimutans]|uniref:RNA polymerase sigma factor n=1 Tax=Anseongella ginsenosidimutans TaxID=496056 RepID=UPI00131595B8|nr:RNA polymerase sigma-70 factor [Anseongella ginsenosidimutans]